MNRTMDAADKLTRFNSLAVKVSPLEIHLLNKDGGYHRRLLCPLCGCQFSNEATRDAHLEARHKGEM